MTCTLVDRIERCLVFDEENFDEADVTQITLVVLRYFLGLYSYKRAVIKLKKYKMSRRFPNFLKKLSDKEIHYYMVPFRRYAKSLINENVIQRLRCRNRLLPEDWKLLKYHQEKLLLNKVRVRRQYPRCEVMIKSLRPILKSSSYDLWLKSKKDLSLGRDDLESELKVKLMETYRTYIFSFGGSNFNKKILYSCLIKSLRTKKLDILSSVYCNKRLSNIRSISYDTLYSTEIECNGEETVQELFTGGASIEDFSAFGYGYVANN